MLGKKELIPVLVILICLTIYFLVEYFINKNVVLEDKNNLIEAFQGEIINQKKLSEMSDTNLNLFTNIKNFMSKERDYYRNDIDISNYMIKKKFNIDQILRKYTIVDGRTRQYGSNPKFDGFMLLKKSYLEGIINEINESIEHINNLRSDTFYDNLRKILEDYKFIYNDRLSYYLDTEPNYLNIDSIMNAFSETRERSRDRPSVTNPVGTNQTVNDYNIIQTINNSVVKSKADFKTKTLDIEKTLNETNNYLDDTASLDKEVKTELIKFIRGRLNITSKMVVRDLSYNFIESIALLALTGTPSEAIIAEKSNALKESNIVVGELIELSNETIETVEEIIKFFSNPEKGSILLEDNEFQYFNAVDKNTKTLMNFCKKMKKIDRPNNNNLLMQRFAKDFIKKKNNQINKLNSDITKLMGEMSIKDAYNHNLNTLRTSEDAKKQINAIKQAKENIDSIGKFKINLK